MEHHGQRYGWCGDRAKILPKGKEEAEKMRKWILRAPRFLYCGTLPVLIYRKLRRLKHILLKTEAENAKAQHHAGQTGENYG